ncbi:MAG: hypothetical protein A2X93_03415 [Deltaproteobacteria bacterium GWC2_56_8]|nr:MAG: hypothetical protein A2X99_04930 [Deltaproteobacteria bacterium GWB2_55_19]OGP32679.1 MAG: hypothetical protein A2X93_03415 [Deltaproteobacteria bacterium GWC2_56_8]HAO92397.1 hypothetical protein [Deltaproteobacteria bacterium]
MKKLISRRSFVKAAIIGTLLLFGKPALATELIEEESSSSNLLLDAAGGETIGKDLYDEAVRENLPEGRLRIYRPRMDEKLDVTFRNSKGEYDEQALKAINHLFRCHHNDEETDIDVRTIEFLNAVDKEIGKGDNLIHVVSGYRSKKYNDMLRKKMRRRVAKNSLHLYGKAVDIRIPDIRTKVLRRTALELELGGVGYYPRAGFVHLDSGRVRRW